MRVELLSCTQNADAICSAAGQSCYSEQSAHDIIVQGEDPGPVLRRIVGMGHHSVIEHAVFTFSVQEVSRALTHQLVRHRIASFSQQSQRYVSMSQVSFVTPPSIATDGKAGKRYQELMQEIWGAYEELAELVPKEDARYLLPNACHTNIVITMNARELLHFFSLRCCNRAQWEIREMALRMMALCQEASPDIFREAGPPCVRGPCPEGKLSCGKPWKREKKLI
ncbi:MAG: FAD-dependent thymidylate synthase [Candidatus Methanomethylophilaceae archaeon]|nr:FAD-dependent thymidylate synthase [Candidatus Methanomethylophilaceae archaeon]